MKLPAIIFATVFSLRSLMAEPGVVDTTASPFAKIQTVGLDEVRWTRGFWADRFELCRAQMVPGMARLMQGTNYSQFYYNFEILAGLVDGQPHGAAFNDVDFYKFLEGASATMAVTNDSRINQKLDKVISVIARGRATNGYIDTWVQLHQLETNSTVAPFRDRGRWEVSRLVTSMAPPSACRVQFWMGC